VDVFGYNLDDLLTVSDQVAGELGKIDGLRDVRLAMVPGSPEIHVSFDRDKLNHWGLNLATVSEVVRGKVRGTVASRLRDRERHIDIRVMNMDEQRNNVQAIGDLIVAESDGVPVPLGAVATMDIARGPSEIHRLGSRRVAVVTANPAGVDLGSVNKEIQARLRGVSLPASTSWELGGQNSEMKNSFRSLQMAILLAVFLVYLVMAATFESFLHPFLVMFTIPLALVGVVGGLLITGTTISVIVLIGVIMLVGIVVNNAIVLIDTINRLRRAGMEKKEAVIRAGHIRLRPILMTTLTTILGLMPMALSWGEGAELRSPLAITVAAGLAFSTLLTLVVIPAAYLAVPSKVPLGPDTGEGGAA